MGGRCVLALDRRPIVQFTSTATHTIRVQSREDGAPDRSNRPQPRHLDAVGAADSTAMTARLSRSPRRAGRRSCRRHLRRRRFAVFRDRGAARNGAGRGVRRRRRRRRLSRHDRRELGRCDALDRRRRGVLLGGGYNVGWIAPGEWLQYSVNVTSAGSYTFAGRVAASGQGGSFHVEMNGANVTGSITIPDTGGWQSWQTVTRTVSLSAGAQTGAAGDGEQRRQCRREHRLVAGVGIGRRVRAGRDRVSVYGVSPARDSRHHRGRAVRQRRRRRRLPRHDGRQFGRRVPLDGRRSRRSVGRRLRRRLGCRRASGCGTQ